MPKRPHGANLRVPSPIIWGIRPKDREANMKRQRRAMMKKKLAALALGLLLGTPGLPAAGANFNFTTIDVPASTRTAANGNSTHAIAGDFDDAGGITHGFVLSGGAYRTIDKPGATSTSVNGINATGQLAGTYCQDAVTLVDCMTPTPISRARGPSPRSTRRGISDRKAASSMRKAKSWGLTGIRTANVMASSGATASSLICKLTCLATTRC